MRLLVFPEITTIDNFRWDLDRGRIMEAVELGVIIWTAARCKARSGSCYFPSPRFRYGVTVVEVFMG